MNQKTLTAVVRKENDFFVFKGASLKELANQMETGLNDIDPCKITIFRDKDKIKKEMSELCSRLEAISNLLNPDFGPSDLDRGIGSILLTDLATDMRALTSSY